jgi:WD40 repeat protein
VRTLLALSLVAIGAACGGDGGDEGEPTPTMVLAPLDADIWTAELTRDPSGTLSVGDPAVAIARTGYDNQPSFVPDGSGFWFTAVDTHDGQADIWRYDLATQRVTRVTPTAPESEYSATPLPDGTGISVVQVETDSTQRLWRFDTDGTDAAVLLAGVAPVGYHAWADPSTLVLFVLGDPPTLQIADVATGEHRTVAERIGRSIQAIPGTTEVSFVQSREDGANVISRLDPTSGAIEPLIEAVEGGEFHTWTPDGTLLMGHLAKLYAWTPGDSDGWTEIADFAPRRISISRLAVSPDGTQIAMVVEPGALGL